MTYQVGNYIDAESEVKRLQQQANLLADAEAAAFVQSGLPETGRVLDLGCGPGYFAARLSERRPGLTIYGIDVDELCLKKAREHITAIKGNARQLPLRAESLDFAYARLALRHIASPQDVIASVHVALKPGARFVIEEVDDASHVVFPEPALFGTVLQARHDAMQRSGGDPYIGRKIPKLLVEAGFTGITAIPLAVCSTQIGRDRFADVVMSAFAASTASELVTQDELSQLRASIERWKSDETAFGMTTVLVFGGTKSA